MTEWDKVVAATEGHTLDTISVHLDGGQSWTYLRCKCQSEAFTEDWDYGDHIRRLVFDALEVAHEGATPRDCPECARLHG